MHPELLITISDWERDGIVYTAQQNPDPIRGCAQVEAYDRVKPEAPHRETGLPSPFIADGQVTFILHGTAASRKVIHDHESAPPREARMHGNPRA